MISEGETLLAQGRLLQAMRRQVEADRCYEEALGIFRRCGSSLGIANALLVIGSSAQLREQPQLAQQHFEEALNIYRKQKNEAGEAAALKALGDAAVKPQQFVIWGIWHWPFIFLGGQYLFGYWGEPVLGPLLFVWTILPSSVIYGWSTLRSGSVWPAAIAHGVNNACCQLMFWFIRPPMELLIGPAWTGIIGSLGYFIIALPIFLIPGALAQSSSVSANMPISKKSGAVEETTGHVKAGIAS